MIYPKFPGKGDAIGICAPSAGAGSKGYEFDISLDTLREAGFRVFETESVRSDGYPSAPADVRGAEFNSLFRDDDIAMVMAATGGDYNAEMLPYIDQELVKAKPKWFAGYSDPTSAEMLLTTVLDIATIYGVNAGAWASRPLHEYQQNSLAVLSGDIPVQHSYEKWASHGFDDRAGCFVMDAPVEWTLLRGAGCGSAELREEHSLNVSGRLIGGCIDVIDWIIGGPYEDLSGFCERYKDDGFIWFFDNFEMTPMNLMYIMLKFRHMGLLDNARAVIFGRTCFPGEATDEDYLIRLERVFGDLDVPLIWGADVGHTKPSMTIINGALGHLKFDNGRAGLKMELR